MLNNGLFRTAGLRPYSPIRVVNLIGDKPVTVTMSLIAGSLLLPRSARLVSSGCWRVLNFICMGEKERARSLCRSTVDDY